MVSVTISIYKPVKFLPAGADINDTGGNGSSDPVDQSQLEFQKKTNLTCRRARERFETIPISLF